MNTFQYKIVEDTKDAVEKFANGRVTLGQLMQMVSLLTQSEEVAVVTDAIIAKEAELEGDSDHKENPRRSHHSH